MKVFSAITIFVGFYSIVTCNKRHPVSKSNNLIEEYRCRCSRDGGIDSGLKLKKDGRMSPTNGVLVAAVTTPDPMHKIEDIIWDFLFGQKLDGKGWWDLISPSLRGSSTKPQVTGMVNRNQVTLEPRRRKSSGIYVSTCISHAKGLYIVYAPFVGSGERDFDTTGNFYHVKNTSENDINVQYLTGRLMHAELFKNKSSVHLPSPDLLHAQRSRLRVTQDYLQTAVDAFAIILEGSMADVLALPRGYVLRSARTISLMRIPLEKLNAMWDVVLEGKEPNSITYETLELYRPLFKYLNGQQISQLNLSDSRVVNYIGTHPELTRHQVGVVASKYIRINREWRESRFLNNMNNLLCGVPMTFMRKIPDAAYLKLEHQIFYHIRACDPLQRRFYLNMMTRTQALGKSFSWSARDVSRLGLLLAEVEGPVLASISPEAMTGISSHVMAEMRPENLKYITELQMQYIKSKAMNIMSRKLKEYDAKMVDTACRVTTHVMCLILGLLTMKDIFYS